MTDYIYHRLIKEVVTIKKVTGEGVTSDTMRTTGERVMASIW